MSSEPQTPSPVALKRDSQGRLLPGQGSLNPGGQPKWLRTVREALENGSAEAAGYLVRVVAGEETEHVVDKDGAAIEVPLRGKDRIAAAKVILEFTVPKPKQELELSSGARPLSGLATELLLRVAADGHPPKP